MENKLLGVQGRSYFCEIFRFTKANHIITYYCKIINKIIKAVQTYIIHYALIFNGLN